MNTHITKKKKLRANLVVKMRCPHATGNILVFWFGLKLILHFKAGKCRRDWNESVRQYWNILVFQYISDISDFAFFMFERT